MASALPRIAFVLNSRSGTATVGGDETIAAACSGRAHFAIHRLEPEKDLVALCEQILRNPLDILVAGGGDGTVSAVASVAVKHRCTLGVLPLGTLNHFAKDLRIPLKLEEAVDNLFSGQVATIDVATLNGVIFVNNASLGLYPQIVRGREALQKNGQHKWVAFAKAAWAVTKRHPFMSVELNIDGKKLVRRTSLVFVGNNHYKLNGPDAGTRASLREGRLCLLVSHSQSRAGLAGLALKSLTGMLNRERDLDSLEARQLRIITGKTKIDVATDGEVRKVETPLDFEVHPRALRVIVPREENLT